jgi:2-polyprenyl-3-methyl-5-hydroxy-6-metoxy-1,4-benzoquinol methylase
VTAEKPEPAFDQYAAHYADILDAHVAFSGETGGYFAAYKARHVARLLGSAFAGRILDFGCGVGTLAKALKDSLPQATVDGYDVSSKGLAQIDPWIAAQGLFSADLSRLDRSYDAIVAANVFHHVAPAERPSAAGRLAGRLAPGGKIFIFEHNPVNPGTQWVVRHIPFDRDAQLLWPGETRRLLRSAGLKNLRTDYIVFFPKPLAWFRPLEPHLTWCPVGAQYVCTAVRT